MANNGSFRDKKVLVTGADGFIGSHLVEHLLAAGCDVKAFTFYNSFNSWGCLEAISPESLAEVEILAGDVRDANGVREVVKGVDVVFHLAALIAIPFSYQSPDSYVDTNIKGTLNILQASRDFGVGKIVCVSTSEVYGSARYVPIDEGHPFQGQSPYSASKIGADRIAESFYRSFDTPVVIARPFNTYGPRQSARAVIPTIITQLLNGCDEIELGSLHPTRDLNYVFDVCAGLMALADCDEAIGKEINIGSGKEISIGELAGLIMELCGREAMIVSSGERVRPGKSEVKRLLCDNTLIKQLTAWSPRVSLREGIARTIEWFEQEKNLKMYKHEIYNI